MTRFIVNTARVTAWRDGGGRALLSARGMATISLGDLPDDEVREVADQIEAALRRVFEDGRAHKAAEIRTVLGVSA